MISHAKDALVLRQLLRNWRMRPDELRAYQDKGIEQVFRGAYEKTPYYRSLLKSAGIGPGDIRKVEDLKYVPVTRRKDLQAAPVSEILAQGYTPQDCIQLRTAGSSGMPLHVYCNRAEARIRRQLQFRSLLQVGFRWNDRLLVLGPETVQSRNIFQTLGIFKSDVVSLMLPVEEQIRRIRALRPTVFWFYPSALNRVLHEVGDDLASIIQPRILISSAEVLSGLLRGRLRDLFSAELFEFYGAVEVGRVATECATHEGLHLSADHIILESVNGEAVLTSLTARTMPFLRYNIGDRITSHDTTCSCGCSFPFIGSIEGRDNEMIRLVDGRVVTPLACDFVLRKFREIEQYRYIHKETDLIQLQLAFGKDFPNDGLLKIRQSLQQLLGEGMRLEIQQVPFIQETGSKFKVYRNEIR